MTVSNTAAPKHLAYVGYLPGQTLINKESGVLEWTADDRLRFSVNGLVKPQRKKRVLFDVPVAEIEKVTVSPNSVMLIKVNGKEYRAYFEELAGVGFGFSAVPIIGPLYALLAAILINKSGIKEWVRAFRAQGVKTYYVSMNAVIAIGVGIGVLIIPMIFFITSFF